MSFCPWTGNALPEPLIEAFFRVAETEFGIDSPCLAEDEPKLPDEMRSDAWWRRRSEAELAALNVPTGEPPEPGPTPNWAYILDLDPRYRPYAPLPLEAIGNNEYLPPGYRRSAGMMPHICDLTLSFYAPSIMATYLPWTREFGIRVVDPAQPLDYQPLRIRPIRFCPECGAALPSSLRDEWTKRLRQFRYESGPYDPEIDAAPPLRTPAYYCFDNWWRDEGL
ncbi:MAG: hypothetical protein KIT00_02860 [Rhodospirillales bacterium]|nr:hypothetical protein [Rhodospirillales bacterium]